MPPKTKTEINHIMMLLAIIEHTDGKCDWNTFARSTGLYKTGKAARDAFAVLKKKYAIEGDAPATPTAPATSAAPITPKTNKNGSTNAKASAKKRSKATGEDDEAQKLPVKKTKNEDEKSSGEEEGGEDDQA